MSKAVGKTLRRWRQNYGITFDEYRDDAQLCVLRALHGGRLQFYPELSDGMFTLVLENPIESIGDGKIRYLVIGDPGRKERERILAIEDEGERLREMIQAATGRHPMELNRVSDIDSGALAVVVSEAMERSERLDEEKEAVEHG